MTAGKSDLEAWFKVKKHPQEALMRAVRELILKADKRMAECIKWNCPTFIYEGNLASFNPQAKKFLSIMFHTGAKIPGKHPDLKGEGGTARYMQIADLKDLAKKKAALRAVVKAWCDSKA
jgi:hypothetical protein